MKDRRSDEDEIELDAESTSQQIWWMLLIVSLTLLILLAPTFLVINPGTPTYAVAQLSAISLLALVFGSGILIFVGWEPF